MCLPRAAWPAPFDKGSRRPHNSGQTTAMQLVFRCHHLGTARNVGRDAGDYTDLARIFKPGS